MYIICSFTNEGVAPNIYSFSVPPGLWRGWKLITESTLNADILTYDS